ncbi:transporter substrate-binding domain-containing protein [Brevibacterium litoralis]|uniref:transporter substrate-binding domain-containing protein n=1 Tax=Brevibacterium litoralis TaxID=3138935 RepID=UPI0032EBAA37
MTSRLHPTDPAPTHRTITRTRAGLAGLGVLALTLVACGSGGDTEADSTLERAQSEGTITVAVANERPYSWVDESGEATGATIAMHEEIFGNLGIEDLEVVEVDWNSLIPGLNAGRFDVISAGMSILPDRCAQAAFSEPEIMYTTTLLVPEGNPNDLSDLDSVAAAGDVTLAVQSGAIEEGYADELGISDVVKVDGAQDGWDTVSNGRADAFALTAVSLETMVSDSPDAGLETTGAFIQEIDGVPQEGAGSTVFRQDDTALLEAYNEEASTILSDEQAYLDLVGEFGFTAENRPPEDLTAAELCAAE